MGSKRNSKSLAKEIKLNYKNLDFVALVDDEDFEYLNQFNWSKNTPGYACRTTRNGNNFKSIIMHRLILKLTDSKIQVDHINGNRLDNRKCNLRLCTNKENSRNQKIKEGKYKGIKKYYNKWEARICVNNKYVYLGLYNSKIDAAKTYNKAALTYFGKFARLNEVDND